MEAILNVVLPVFAIILSGYLSGRFGILGADSSEALNRFVYYVALPTLLFFSMASVEPAVIFNWPFIATYLGGQVLTLIPVMIIARMMFRRRLAETGLHGMTTIFGNTGYMGIPLVMAAFGAEGMLPAVIATVINSAIVVAGVAAVIEADLSTGGGRAEIFRDVAKALAGNPLLVAPAAGILWSFTGLDLPVPVASFSQILGAAAGPAALFAIGLFMVGKSPRLGAGEVGYMVFVKLVIHPLITLWLASMLLDTEPLWATVAVLLAALPTGANTFVLASRYGFFEQRASSSILVSTVVSVVTLSILLAAITMG